MMRFLACISYDGSKFYGFQKLVKEKTIQGELEKVLSKINKGQVDVKGAGRTDRGVHAINQIVHFELDININEKQLKSAINSILDKAIYVKYCKKVNNKFHARFDAIEKTYEYQINLGDYNPILNDYIYNYNRKLDIKEMRKASKHLLGLNSYKAFVSGTNHSYNSVLYNITIKKIADILYIRLTGKTFYNHMVRNLVGALILVGTAKINHEELKEMLIKEENIYNYNTVPSSGLYLMEIVY